MIGLTHKLNTFALKTPSVLSSKHHKHNCEFSNLSVLLINFDEKMMPRINHDTRNQAIGMLAAGMTVRKVARRLRDIATPLDLFAAKPQLTFMHDCATPHTAIAVGQHLANSVLPWSSKYSDLNLIENLWDELERRLRAHQR